VPSSLCSALKLNLKQSSSSYECDGCAHHASFHSMENKQEDEIRKRWEQEAKNKQEREEGVAARPKKRLREIEYRIGDGGAGQARGLERGMLTLEGHVGDVGSSQGKAAGRGKGKKGAVGRTTRAKGRTVVMDADGDEEYIELD